MFGFARGHRRSSLSWSDLWWRWQLELGVWLPRFLWTLVGLLLFAVAFVGFSEPFARLTVVARWVFATFLDAVGLGHIPLSVDTNKGEVWWEATVIHIESWHLGHVEIVLASFWTGLSWGGGLFLFSGFLVLVWRFRKRWSTLVQAPAPSVPIKVGYRQASLPAGHVASPAAQLHDDSEKAEPASRDDEAPALDEVFGHNQFVTWPDETRSREPVARHAWNYRPS